MLETMITLPWPRAAMRGITRLVSHRMLRRLTVMVASQSASPAVRDRPRVRRDAGVADQYVDLPMQIECRLHQVLDLPPHCHVAGKRGGPAARAPQLAGRRLARLASSLESTTTAPARPSSWAMARPMPRDAPVTSATWPVRSKSMERTTLPLDPRAPVERACRSRRRDGTRRPALPACRAAEGSRTARATADRPDSPRVARRRRAAPDQPRRQPRSSWHAAPAARSCAAARAAPRTDARPAAGSRPRRPATSTRRHPSAATGQVYGPSRASSRSSSLMNADRIPPACAGRATMPGSRSDTAST